MPQSQPARLTILIEGPNVDEVKSALNYLQTTLGSPDLGITLNFCLSLAMTAAEKAIQGHQLGFYEPEADEFELFSYAALDILLELSHEDMTPEDPPPD